MVLLELQVAFVENEDGAFIVVVSAVVGGGEDSDDVREALLVAPAMHLEAVYLHLMATEDRHQLVGLQEALHGLLAEVV